ncbi:AAA domain-containing protein [Pengzhenrongella sicca]|uniref:AAA family ATPase n=1 Tax=Pengzhenrongella sicca TaxID=2819238 RepID=A0A8A4ZGF8_9MICO|nr:AAA domain-containing protein [Pengzhenrongella sicca]QTE30033.1 AAA family ATPase [Pengzhenrongella sicca]
MEYHRRAVARASVSEPIAISRRSAWRILDLESEALVTGLKDHLTVTGAITDMFAELPDGESVYYGWPVIALADRTGSPHLAPVVMTELQAPGIGDEMVVARDDEPYANPGLFCELYFPADTLSAVDDALTAPLPFGDAAALTERVHAVLIAAGLDAGSVDPRMLARRGELRPGVHNLAMVFRGPSNGATRALSEELRELLNRNDWQHTAAAALVAGLGAQQIAVDGATNPAAGADLVSGLPPLSVRALRLNDSQEQALAAASIAAVTVVTGPPGTGKSQLVAGIVANQWLAGRTVLVASTNNNAVQVAVERCRSIDPALLIRTGNAEHRELLPAIITTLMDRGRAPGMSRQIIRRQLDAAANDRSQIFASFTARAAAEQELAQTLRDLEGLRAVVWGSPTAEPTRSERRQLHALIRKHAASRWLAERRGRKIVELAHPSSDAVTLQDVLAWAALDARGAELTTYLTALGAADPDVDRAALAGAEHRWSEAGHQALTDTIQGSLTAGRPVLHQLSTTRRQYRAARTAAIRASLQYLPAWACTTLPVRESFPLTAGLFDLLVIDEASQCAIAHILPLAYRARRIVVVGDPNQLNPIVNLKRAHLETIAAACGTTETAMHLAGLSAGTDSAYTAFAARVGGSPHLLDEHYRCHPQIAQFINNQFYGGALRVLTDVSTFNQSPRGLAFVNVPGRCEQAKPSGAYNQAEVDAITDWVLEYHTAASGTLGIVTPFSAQVDLLGRQLRSALGPEKLAAARITIGTAHAFQGGECDVVLFSLVLADGVNAGTAKWVENQRNLINVAVSRAKRALIAFGNQDALALLPVPTLHALVAAAAKPGPSETVGRGADIAEVGDLHSEAERRLYSAMVRRNLPVQLKPIIEGYELDFAIQTPTGLVDIEVDGDHHSDERGRQRRQDLARDAVLNAINIRVIRVPAWSALSEPDSAARKIAGLLTP